MSDWEINYVVRPTPALRDAVEVAAASRVAVWSRGQDGRACDSCFGYWMEAGAPEDKPPNEGYTIIVDSGKATLMCDDHYEEYCVDLDSVPGWQAVVFLPLPDEAEVPQ